MKSRYDLIIPSIVLLLLFAIPIWIFAKYSEEFSFYKDISKNGLETSAILVKKGILVNNKIEKAEATHPSDNHQFIVNFKDKNGEAYSCQLGVSKNTYDVVSKKDQLSVLYLSKQPQKCTLPASVDLMLGLTAALLFTGLIFLLLALGFLYYIYKSFKKPKNPVDLTTNLELAKGNLACPKCGLEMNEGYMPTVGGVSWRDRDESIGIPTILNGLPGTTFWVKRPLLHGFHCKSCEIITFKYGKI